MKELEKYQEFYFLGIGGIGMSALARYFNGLKYKVHGYDSTKTALTNQLEKEDISIHFHDLDTEVLNLVGDKNTTLVVYTPAIPVKLKELQSLKENGYRLIKRAELLGYITRKNKSIAVAGTHGKTTTSCMLAHLLTQSDKKCHAFLGGISTNYNTNFITSENSDYTVVEADEFDRSFLHLNPDASILTSIEADHLDIYKDKGQIEKAFSDYVEKINPDGFLVKHFNIPINHSRKNITYGVELKNADFNAINIRYENSKFCFDLDGKIKWEKIELGIPGVHNVENALSVIALALEIGLDEATIRKGLSTFQGVKRRFEIVFKDKDRIFIDDYAHHPTAIKQLITSVKLMFPQQNICIVFQPHLFSRTKDFMDEFASELSRANDVIILPIYPAREEPIKGITSEKLLEKIDADSKKLVQPEKLPKYISQFKGVILTVGAGDISNLVPKIKAILNE